MHGIRKTKQGHLPFFLDCLTRPMVWWLHIRGCWYVDCQLLGRLCVFPVNSRKWQGFKCDGRQNENGYAETIHRRMCYNTTCEDEELMWKIAGKSWHEILLQVRTRKEWGAMVTLLSITSCSNDRRDQSRCRLDFLVATFVIIAASSNFNNES